MRAHWKLAWVPLGFSAILYGNSLYETSQQRLGLILFFGGWFLSFCGMPALRRFLDENPLRKEDETVALLWLFVLACALPPVFTAAKAAWGVAQPDEYQTAAAWLGLIYFVLPLAVWWAESKGSALRRLPSRIQQAVICRIVANAAGIGAIAMFLSARFVIAYPAPLISTALTLVVAMAVVTHKTFARARKLCTQTHIDVQNLLRDMDELDEAKGRDRVERKLRNRWPSLRAGEGMGDKHADKRMAVRRSWEVLELDLRTTVDTGYRLFGLSFLADDAVADLENKVLAGIEAANSDATGPARDDLNALLNACAGRIDVLA
ncbi:hypothetical protein B591_31228 (plasmid) [Streptomyces sp. GBA 94-10 4N24]|nr:hypothetical protein B591_31228 [Streptomyces sp. GBA 94-10 4N24]UZN63225.1 hypothetical protein B591N_31228 [Streptomyces sp. GBA 94-10 4N24]